MPTAKKTARKTVKTQPGAAEKRASAANAPTAEKHRAEGSVPLDRRAGDRRGKGERRKKVEPVAIERRALQRRVKVNRRRQIDPTTCERDYSGDEIEFMSALDDYKHVSGRMFPTCSEVLEVLRKLGYEKRPKVEGLEPAAGDAATSQAAEATRA
jgi:hypothetical protein